MMFPNRLTHAAVVDVAGGAATLLGTLGGVASVTYNGVGDYTVTLKAPGVPGYAEHTPIPVVTINGNLPGSVACMLPAATTFNVFMFDDAGVAADRPFSFAIFTSERTGAAP